MNSIFGLLVQNPTHVDQPTVKRSNGNVGKAPGGIVELKRFADKWCHKDYTPEPVHAEELVATESELKIRLPADYRQ